MKLKLKLLLSFSLFFFLACSKETPDRINDYDLQALASLDWGEGTTFTIGHKNPDTDATCSAICYAYLMRQFGYNVEARVPGDVNNETAFVLDWFNTETPEIMNDASGKRIILTDHSEAVQAVNGIEEARILQIIDHHGLGSIVEANPLFIKTMPVGSTCTVIYYSFKDYQVELIPPYAGLMLSALLSDTKNMTSSTTTELDRIAYQELLTLSGISNIDLYYQNMQDAASSYFGMNDVEIFLSDYKDYSDISGYNIGVTCVNSRTDNHNDICTRMLAIMPQILTDNGRDMVFAIVINVQDEYTDILYYGEGAKAAAESAFGQSSNNRIRVQGMMSRKKDFIPKITEVFQQK